MSLTRYLVLLGFTLSLVSCGADPTTKPVIVPTDNLQTVSITTQDDERPNILYILADDLGYADLGFLGSEIPTPNLDELAGAGMLLTNFYAGLACSPTRSMLMSGTDSHIAGLGTMSPPRREEHLDQPGYEGYLNTRVASLADLMTDAGYNTYMTGKWHLGKTEETSPAARGFKHSFISLDGAAHLGNLSWNGPGLAPYRDEDALVTVSDDFYTTRFYTERMIEYIEADRDEGKPFFAWLAYTAPHWPLQAPAASIEKFEGMYDEGYEVLYRNRFARMKELELLAQNTELPDDDIWQVRWNSLSAEEKQIEARKMEIYAAMVSDLDTYIGEMIAYLKSIDEFDNTLIMFMSDNGAESGRRELSPPTSNWVAECCDNSYENLGRGDSYVMYGRDWATVSAAPFRRHKATAFEGGIHVPAFVHFQGMVEPGVINDGFGTVMDLLPTFLDLAGTEHPGLTYRGQPVEPVRGSSLLPAFRGETDSVHSDEEYTGWELNRYRSLRQGDWKISWDQALGEDAHWELFNLAEDIIEQNDLAVSNPEKLAAMILLWDRYDEESGVIY
jgi:arylsulfatase A-like enzyme